MTIFEAFVTLTAQEEETMIFSKYVEPTAPALENGV